MKEVKNYSEALKQAIGIFKSEGIAIPVTKTKFRVPKKIRERKKND